MTMTEKRRTLSRNSVHLKKALWYPVTGAYVGGQSYISHDIFSTQITRSEGHPWPKAKGVRDVGGPFDTASLVYSNDGAGGSAVYSRANGPFVEHNDWTYAPAPAGEPASFKAENVTFDEMLIWIHGGNLGRNLGPVGTNFIAQTLPTNPVVDGAVSIAELYREGIPNMVGASLLKGKIDFFRNMGEEYLNYQFGWLPLVSSIKDAAKAITESHAILQQLARDSGKNIYRKRHSPPDLKTTVVEHNGGTYPNGVAGADVVAPPWYRLTDSTRTETWFSGCYTYQYEPTQMDNLERIVQEASLLYGLELTPEVLWNLAPWSWLVDWVANVGPVVHNISAFQQDGLVIRYGYVMEKTTRTVRRVNTIRPAGHAPIPHVYGDSFIGTRKRRVQATPYGFGLTLDAFTNRQWSILAALGMTRGNRSLK